MTSSTHDAAPTPASPDGKRALLRHAVATLAYRGAKAVRGAPPEFATWRAGDGSRSPAQIVAHLGDLLEWALSLAQGPQVWKNSEPRAWNDDVARFFSALDAFDAYLASDAALARPAEQLFQGPVADALTHVGQLTMLRRLSGSPIRGENYAKAEIVAGRVSENQVHPQYEFD